MSQHMSSDDRLKPKSDEHLPTAYFVLGPAGSGKSTVSRFLARRDHAAYIDKDSVSTAFTERILELSGNDPHERDNNAYYQSHILPIEYATILRLCGDNLRVGASVVLDAPFGRFIDDDDFLVNAAAEHDWPDARLVVVHVATTGETVLTRLRARGLARDAWKVGNWDVFWKSVTTATCAWKGATHVTVNNSGVEPDLSPLSTAATVTLLGQ